VTDANGLVTVNFDKPGTYHLSANRLNDAGERNIVRPYAKVVVKEEEVIEVPKVDKEALKSIIEEAELSKTKGKTDESIDALNKAISDALIVLEDKSATQKEVDTSVEVVDKAIQGLTEIPEESDSLTEKELKDNLNNSINSAIGYAENHFPDFSSNRSGSHSDYWAFSVFWGAGIKDLENDFSWKGGVKPSAPHTFWAKKLSKANRTSNEDAGTIIGAVLLDQSPYDFGTQNVVADLEAKQKDNGSFFHIWGESWAMIALELVDSQVYEKDKHIDHILSLQDADGMFGGADSTGWMLTALAPYTKSHPAVKKAIDKSITHIHNTYKDEGKLPGMEWGENSNSITSMHMGLAANGEKLLSDKWTNEQNIIREFIEAYQFEDGSFAWHAGSTSGALNMSTEQVILSFATIKEQESIFTQLKAAKDILPEAPEESTVDFSKLEAAIEEGNKVDATNLTDESKAALTKAITDAEKVLADKSAKQKEVDVAVDAINEILQNLTEKPIIDFSKLEAAIEAGNKVDTTNLTDESKAALTKAMADAEKVLADKSITQKEVDVAVEAINEILQNLTEKPTVDFSKLEAAIKAGNKVDATNLTDESKTALTKAMADAEKVLADKSITQKEVDVAAEAINEILQNLTEKPTVDKSELEGLIVSASNMNTDGNTEESIQNLLNAIEKANQILNNNDVTQKEVDQAI